MIAAFALCLTLLAASADEASADVETATKTALESLRGHTGFAFTELTDAAPKVLYGIRADERFAVGSSFKLFIFGTLIDEVNSAESRLDNTMLLERALTGPPHSELAEWPVGSPVTLHTLALKMISISDNMATDHLHHLLGRERIERQMQQMGHSDSAVNRPLLCTREMTMLRDRNAGLPARYYHGLNESEKRRYLREHCEKLPSYSAIDFDTSAYELAEWYASPLDMAKALAWIARNTEVGRPAHAMRAILAMDPKLSYDAKTWPFVGFKGGSEDQLLAGNWLLQHKNGRWYTMHFFWNCPTDKISPEKALKVVQHILAAIEPTLSTQP